MVGNVAVTHEWMHTNFASVTADGTNPLVSGKVLGPLGVYWDGETTSVIHLQMRRKLFVFAYGPGADAFCERAFLLVDSPDIDLSPSNRHVDSRLIRLYVECRTPPVEEVVFRRVP